MTYEGMISNLIKLREHSMMPAVFKPTLNAILEYFAYEDAPKAGWIPVSERLPKEREEVLVTVSNEFETFADVDSWMGGSFWTYIDAVTAWMPLPDPYREDGEA